MHKDPYENIYSVVSGHKDFILIPPVSYHNVPRRNFPSGIFKTNEKTGELDIQPIVDGEFYIIFWTFKSFPVFLESLPVNFGSSNPNTNKCVNVSL